MIILFPFQIGGHILLFDLTLTHLFFPRVAHMAFAVTLLFDDAIHGIAEVKWDRVEYRICDISERGSDAVI